jgi:hypothetical protein
MRIAQIILTVFEGIGVGIATHWLSLPSNGCPRRRWARTSEPPATSTLHSGFGFGIVGAQLRQNSIALRNEPFGNPNDQDITVAMLSHRLDRGKRIAHQAQRVMIHGLLQKQSPV